jgi:DNA-directed RNA polymerase specialized sigma24 family protein
LTYLEKLPGEAIAQRLAIKIDNVYKRRERGLDQLERILREHHRS